MKKIRVSITLIHGRTIWGYIYLEDEQRMQDLLNDERKFIPIDIVNTDRSRTMEDPDKHKMMVVHKDSIISMEEK